MQEKLVTADHEVTAEGSALLAFVDMMQERDIRWSASQNRDGSYKFDVMVGGVVVSAVGVTIVEGVRELGQKMIAVGMQGAPSA